MSEAILVNTLVKTMFCTHFTAKKREFIVVKSLFIFLLHIYFAAIQSDRVSISLSKEAFLA